MSEIPTPLMEICLEVTDIIEGMYYGSISFEYDNLMMAMKAEHPALILDHILGQVYWHAQDPDIDLERVKNLIKELKEFKKNFKVRQLTKPIKHFEEYLKEHSEE